jgi:hypothetical protein
LFGNEDLRLKYYFSAPFNHFKDFQTGGNIMGKYLLLWETDQTKIPVDPKERKDTWSLFMAVVRQEIRYMQYLLDLQIRNIKHIGKYF